jgi:SAM-dependent methyltransferase
VNDSAYSLPEGFIQRLLELEDSYLTAEDPIRQSGYGGGEVRWREERELILEPVDRDGDFLDVGCANGYLLECLVQWAKERGTALTPYGVDIGPRLIELATRRLPEYASHFWIANAWSWRPPRRFRYVYTLRDCVPEHLLGEYIARLLARCVEDDGTFIIGAYGSLSRDDPARDLARDLAELGFTVAGSAVRLRGSFPLTHIAWIRS